MRIEIGSRIRSLRLASELTQAELAARARLTKGFISQLERDQTSISLDSLLDILDALGISISEFFDDRRSSKIVFSPKDRIQMPDKEVDRFEMLVPGSTNNLMDPIIVSLAPGEQLPEEQPHAGEEFGYVITGTLTLTVGKKANRIPARNCFYFESDQKHQYANKGQVKTRFLWITSPPQM